MTSQTPIRIKKTETITGVSWKIDNWNEYVALLKERGTIKEQTQLRPCAILMTSEVYSDSADWLDVKKQIALLFQLSVDDIQYCP